MPPDSGSCSDPAAGKEEARFYYSAKNLKCTEMPYSGCGGNPNNFKSLAECNEKCGKKRKNYKFSTYFPTVFGRLYFYLMDKFYLHLLSSWHCNGEGYFSSPEGLQVLVRKQDIQCEWSDPWNNLGKPLQHKLFLFGRLSRRKSPKNHLRTSWLYAISIRRGMRSR